MFYDSWNLVLLIISSVSRPPVIYTCFLFHPSQLQPLHSSASIFIVSQLHFTHPYTIVVLHAMSRSPPSLLEFQPVTYIYTCPLFHQSQLQPLHPSALVFNVPQLHLTHQSAVVVLMPCPIVCHFFSGNPGLRSPAAAETHLCRAGRLRSSSLRVSPQLWEELE